MALQFNNEYDRLMAAQMQEQLGLAVGAIAAPAMQTLGKKTFGWKEGGYKGTQSQWNEDALKRLYSDHIEPDLGNFQWEEDGKQQQFRNFADFKDRINVGHTYEDGKAGFTFGEELAPGVKLADQDWYGNLIGTSAAGQAYTADLAKGYDGTFKDDG